VILSGWNISTKLKDLPLYGQNHKWCELWGTYTCLELCEVFHKFKKKVGATGSYSFPTDSCKFPTAKLVSKVGYYHFEFLILY